ncbi:MAG TPA: hypothetical protein DEQ14_10605 [Treponema sp.]|nr:hypothetical protein [Treponema sp.]
MNTREKSLYTLISLEDFKAVMGVDDREDRLCRFCLVTATRSIEQYCRRRLALKNHFERFEFTGELFLPLREYPVQEVLSAYVVINERGAMGKGVLLEPDFYDVVPDCGSNEDWPYAVSFSPALLRCRGIAAIKICYAAGYDDEAMPPDLQSACLELAAWNMSRYRGRRIGMTGNVRGGGRDGEHFELSMPENVRALLEPYRRKTI